MDDDDKPELVDKSGALTPTGHLAIDAVIKSASHGLLHWPPPWLHHTSTVTVTVPDMGGLNTHSFTFGSKEQARQVRDALNGMTLEGRL